MAKEIKHLPSKTGPKEINPPQAAFDLHIDRQKEIQGIEMGVLSDGTPGRKPHSIDVARLPCESSRNFRARTRMTSSTSWPWPTFKSRSNVPPLCWNAQRKNNSPEATAATSGRSPVT
jgi:hypothetical protein